MATQRPRAFIGREISCPFPGQASGVPDEKTQTTLLASALQSAFSHQFDFVALPLVRSGLRRDQSVELPNGGEAPATFSDKELTPTQWSTCVLGQAQVFPFAPDPALQQPLEPQRQLRAAEEALCDEIAWAVHLGLSAVMVPPPRRPSECSMYARAFNTTLQSEMSTVHLWLEVPVSPNSSFASTSSSTTSTSSASSTAPSSSIEGRDESSWEMWNRMRCYCDFNTRLNVCLTLTADLPSSAELSRWMGEPVKGCVIPTSVFLTNDKGFPVLSRSHQNFILQLFNYEVQFIIRPTDTATADDHLLPYMQYLVHLQTKRPAVSEEEAYTRSYYDHLQAPLQPLMDNLESATYDVFEKDPIKYSQYQKAVHAALLTLPHLMEVVIMVVGAGRGPLIQASLHAADELGRTVKMYAVEKNPNAVITLRHRVLSTPSWRDRVDIISGDMREWDAPVKADIMVSELLGSFGDNELSPECLDGAQSFLKPDTGICIPQNYTSFLAPIMSSKLWNGVSMFKDLKHVETQYVVRLHNVSFVAKAEQCFYFEHPSVQPADNSRHVRIAFDPAAAPATIHGFAGYFESTLFGDVMISINPKTVSVGMFSWFPLYIPLRVPIKCNQGDRVVVDMWRCTDAKKVWYEWAAETSCGVTSIHNPGGRSQWIGL